MILGINGYIGNALRKHMEGKFEVVGCDNNTRSLLVGLIGGKSLTPMDLGDYTVLDVTDYLSLSNYIEQENPDVIIHLAEQPSAPYSMKGPEESSFTQHNNIIGSLNVLWAIKEINPKIHLIKIGTAGEYPDWLYPPYIKIPEESRTVVQKDGKDWVIPTPRYGGSFYHMSKLHDSFNCDYANRIWGLDITDLNQAPLYGHVEGNRFDYDEHFGTVVNRFVVQALIGHPLTVYGEGNQTRGYIHLKNAMEAIELVIKNRPKGYQTIHQLTETKTVNEIAELVKKHTGCKIKKIENPRAENGRNEFDFEMKKLKEWGLETIKMEDSIEELIKQIKPHIGNVIKEVINPKTKWK